MCNQAQLQLRRTGLQVEPYHEVALSDRLYKFKNAKLGVEDKERTGRPKCTRTRNWKHYWRSSRAKRKNKRVHKRKDPL